jgi:hypothetical protein
MYGTIAKLKVKDDFTDALKRTEERHPRGYIGSFVYKSDKEPDTWWMVVMFEDKDSYFENADSPEQDRDYRELRKHLKEDPEWNDGEIIYSTEQILEPC